MYQFAQFMSICKTSTKLTFVTLGKKKRNQKQQQYTIGHPWKSLVGPDSEVKLKQ